MRFQIQGRISTFGGPQDAGVGPAEGLALVEPTDLPTWSEYFLPQQPPGTTGLARRLNPDAFYLACRWDYRQTSRAFLRSSMATVTNLQTGQSVQAKPVDWGPDRSTGRIADLSPGLARHLGLQTDDKVEVQIP